MGAADLGRSRLASFCRGNKLPSIDLNVRLSVRLFVSGLTHRGAGFLASSTPVRLLSFFSKNSPSDGCCGSNRNKAATNMIARHQTFSSVQLS